MLDDEKAGNPIKLGFGIESTFIRRIIKELYDWGTPAQISVSDKEASRRNMRSDLIQWDRAKLDLLSLEKADMAREANRIVKQIIADHHMPVLDEAVIQEGDSIIKTYEKEVSQK